MALRLISLLLSLVLVGFLATNLRTRLQSNDDPTATTPVTLLRDAGMIVERTHKLTGVYGGIALQRDSPLRLVSADASGYCIQLIWLNRPYNLRGPGGKAVQGPC